MPPPRPMIDGRLRCSKCGAWKLPEDFHRDASRPAGRQSSCRECVKVYDAARYAANPEKALAGVRAVRLRRKGWTVESFDAALIAQGGKCANPGCDVKHTDSKLGLHADHCHTTGRPRVLLCNGCNCALGLLGEDSQRIAGLLELNDSFSQVQ